MTTTIAGNARSFVARSLGTPLAVTERKYYDQFKNNTAFADGGSNTISGMLDPTAAPANVNTLFAPIQGDDYNTRQGRKVHIMEVKVRGSVNVPAIANLAVGRVAGFVRLIMVIDKQTNAAQMNSQDLISNRITGFQNPAFFGRFRILKDKTFNLPQPVMSWDGTNMETGGFQIPFKWKFKFRKPLLVHFNGTNGGTIADIIDNSLHMVGWTSDLTTTPGLSYNSRTTFIDV